MSFTTPFNLAGLNGTTGFRLDGAAANDQSGWSVASAGDVNGDGFADVIVGANQATVNGNSFAGVSYVVFGKAGGWTSSVALSGLNGTDGFRLEGAGFFHSVGQSVASAGDINGDGFADLIIGADTANPNGTNFAGSSYVVFGKASGWTPTLALSALDGTTGFRLDGAALGDRTGVSVASAGDVNADGFADLIVGAYFANPGGVADAGASYVVFGRASGWTPTVALASLNGTTGFRLDGAAATDYSGRSVASAGDVNGDGFADVIVGANQADPSGAANSGSSYVVFGKAGGWTATIPLSTLNGTTGFRIDGTVADDQSGFSVASAGDLNGDGFSDLLVGAPLADPGGNLSAGSVYVVFGKASGWAPTLALSSLDGTTGFRIDGVAFNDLSGGSVAAAGDLNGDGFADLVVGAFGADPNGISDGGSSYVLFGKASGWAATLSLSAFSGTTGFRLDGVAASDQSGQSVASAGDVDGDGFADLIIGAPYADPSGTTMAGSSYVYFSPATGGAMYRGTTLADTLRGTPDADRMFGFAQNDTLFGNGGDDTIEGGAGNDVLDGGAGNDTASYAGASSGVTVSLALGTAQNSVGAGTDRLAGFENLLGSAFADTLIGSAGNNQLAGSLGNDELRGGSGVDTAVLSGNRSATTLTKNAGPGWTAVGPDGTDTLASIERVQFADQTVLSGFARTEDMAGRGFGDMLFQNVAEGWLYRWQMEGTARTAESAIGGPGTGWVVAGKADFSGDLNADILWRNTATGDLYVWLMNGASKIGEGGVGRLFAGQSVAGVGDMNGDGRADALLRGADGSWSVFGFNGTTVVLMGVGSLDTTWAVAAVADFNGDLKADILWRNSTTGQLYLWQMDGTTVAAQGSYATPGSAFVVAGTGDLNGDGRADVVIKHATQNWLWGYVTDAETPKGGINGWLGAESGGYTLQKIADYTGDDRADLLFYDATQGFAFLQSMDGLGVLAQQGAGSAGAGFAIL